jgi:hypothetical protein
MELFTQKIVTMLSKIWVRDPGSGIRDPEKNLFWIPYPGSRGQKRHRIPDPGSQIRIRNTWFQFTHLNPFPDGPRASPLTDGPRSDWN